MNPKTINDLDPKLRETYERVMGSSVPASPQANSQPATPANTPIMQTTPLSTQAPTPVVSTPINSTPQPTPVAQVYHPVAQATQPIQAAPQPQANVFSPGAPAAAATSVSTASAKKGGKLLPILLVLGGIIFLGGYLVVWLFVFGIVKLP